MRIQRTANTSIFDLLSDHAIGLECKAISTFLDRHPEILEKVAADLRKKDVKKTGRTGLPAESVVRCALLKQMRQLSFHELSFHLSDSASFQAFARLPLGWFPKNRYFKIRLVRSPPRLGSLVALVPRPRTNLTGPPRYRGECVQCVWRADEDKPALKIRWSSAK